jgi:phosphatidylethanolamine-binding protein (PEBP) family uncharacterized protein
MVELPDVDLTGRITRAFSCEGESRALRLRLRDLPRETVAVAATVERKATGDTDAESLWVVWSAPGRLAWLIPGDLPAGTSIGVNGEGSNIYLPPCPQQGTEEYVVTAYALREPLPDVEPQARTASALRASVAGRLLAKGTITTSYTPGSRESLDVSL